MCALFKNKLKIENMNIYEFVTPSDAITFKADDDKVAFTCALILGNGKAGCQNTTTSEKLPTMLIFSSNPEGEIAEFIGGDLKDFIEQNRPKISDCFKSFSYGSVSDRRTYDLACEAFTDHEKLAEFKKEHEDSKRTSMSRWVKSAWDMGEKMSKQ